MITPDYTIMVDDPKDADMSVVVNSVPYGTEIQITMRYAQDENTAYKDIEEVAQWTETLKQGDNTIKPQQDIDKFGIYWYEIQDTRNNKTNPYINSAKLKVESSGVYTSQYNESYN